MAMVEGFYVAFFSPRRAVKSAARTGNKDGDEFNDDYPVFMLYLGQTIL
jgi:hypothetical protein